jgi:hypothetical protein
MLDEMGGVVEHHVAQPAAEDDAERHPEDKVVVIRDGQRRPSAPQRLRAQDGARIEPAAENSHDIGERVPADGKRPDAQKHRVEAREGDGVQGHRGICRGCG